MMMVDGDGTGSRRFIPWQILVTGSTVQRRAKLCCTCQKVVPALCLLIAIYVHLDYGAIIQIHGLWIIRPGRMYSFSQTIETKNSRDI